MFDWLKFIKECNASGMSERELRDAIEAKHGELTEQYCRQRYGEFRDTFPTRAYTNGSEIRGSY